MRLDKATLNVIGGTIGRIEAVTGWRLIAGAKQASINAMDIVKKAFSAIRDHLPKLPSYAKGHRKKVKALEKALI